MLGIAALLLLRGVAYYRNNLIDRAVEPPDFLQIQEHFFLKKRRKDIMNLVKVEQCSSC